MHTSSFFVDTSSFFVDTSSFFVDTSSFFVDTSSFFVDTSSFFVDNIETKRSTVHINVYVCVCSNNTVQQGVVKYGSLLFMCCTTGNVHVICNNRISECTVTRMHKRYHYALVDLPICSKYTCTSTCT